MLKRLKNALVQVSVPDEQDMAEHYRTPAEKTADLIVHVVGLTLAGVGGILQKKHLSLSVYACRLCWLELVAV